MGLQGVVTCPANRKSDGFDSRIVHQLRYIQQSIINLTQGKSAAERLRRCKSYPRPPLWVSSEVDKHSGVVFLSVSCEYASVAQLVRAPASYAGGCGFESHRWYQGFGKDSILLGVVAQEGEQRREAVG